MLLRGNVWQTFSKWAEIYGKIYRVTVLDQVYICVSEPELIKQVMQKSVDKYLKDPHNYAKFSCLLGKGASRPSCFESPPQPTTPRSTAPLLPPSSSLSHPTTAGRALIHTAPPDCEYSIRPFAPSPPSQLSFPCFHPRLTSLTGIVTSEGERWHGLRRQLAPTFKLEILEGVGLAAVNVTKRLFVDLDTACESGAPVDLSELFRKITLQVLTVFTLRTSLLRTPDVQSLPPVDARPKFPIASRL